MKQHLGLNRSLALALGLVTIGGLGHGLFKLSPDWALLPSDVFLTVLVLGFMVLAPLCSSAGDPAAEDGAGPTAAPDGRPHRSYTETTHAAFRDGMCCLTTGHRFGRVAKRCRASCAARVGGAIYKRTGQW